MFPIYFEINFHDPEQPLAAHVVQQCVPRANRKDVNNNDRNSQIVGAEPPQEHRDDVVAQHIQKVADKHRLSSVHKQQLLHVRFVCAY